MTITFLGTAASEGYPVAFCRCDNCHLARDLGGPNLRHRSAALVDGVLLLDLGPDVMAASLALGVPLTDVRYCLLTHEHDDHLDGSNLISRSPSAQVEAPPMALYGTLGALRYAAAALEVEILAQSGLDPAAGQRFNLSACSVSPGETFHAGPYRITAIPARHDASIVPLLYVIEKAGRALFYATDTGPLPAEAWAALAGWGGRFNLVVLDHTFGLMGRSTGHNNADQFVETVELLRASGRLADDCRVLAHHIGHHSNPDHATLSRYAAERGYAVAHDGLSVRV
jgi:phosphoribosyl 1,2-cyclic phosphate phosphodiesterase